MLLCQRFKKGNSETKILVSRDFFGVCQIFLELKKPSVKVISDEQTRIHKIYTEGLEFFNSAEILSNLLRNTRKPENFYNLAICTFCRGLSGY